MNAVEPVAVICGIADIQLQTRPLEECRLLECCAVWFF
jgi:hypothetical protein